MFVLQKLQSESSIDYLLVGMQGRKLRGKIYDTLKRMLILEVSIHVLGYIYCKSHTMNE